MNASTQNLAYKHRQFQRGLSLVELMIAIAIGLIILVALSVVLVNQSKIRNELDKSNRMIDNGRYAMEILSENIQNTGYFDQYAPSGTPGAAPDPCSVAEVTNAATNINVLLHHVQGYNAATVADTPAGTPCGLTTRTGSDILVLRRVSTANPIAAAAATAATVYMQVSNCTNDALPGYKIALGSATFTTNRKKDCATSSDLRPFIVQTYFVSPNNNAGDGIPTLKRVELDAAGAFVTTPLVEGIEYMQIDYGLDTNSDGAADSYIAAPVTANWPNIVSLKVSIIARNLETTSDYTDTKTYSLGLAGTYTPASGDHYKRHAYTQVIRLVNPSGRKETP